MSITTRVLLIAVALLLAVVVWQRTTVATAKQQAKESTATAEAARSLWVASEQARKTEQARAEKAEAVAATYEQEKRDAEQKGEAVAAGVRAGSIELQQRWAGCETQRLSEAAERASQPDAGSEDRAASAGRIVQAAAECDAQVRGLQALVKADREQ